MSGTVRKICLLGFGEVGFILAQDLLANTAVDLVIWDRLFPQRDSRPNQRLDTLMPSQRITKATRADEAAFGADLVICAVTAEQDLPAAESVLFAIEPYTWFLDLNSVSPATKMAVANQVNAAGGRYVEAAVMSPVGPKRIATPILLSGPNGLDFLPVARELGFNEMSVLSATQGQAAASKMCRSVIVKGVEALVAEALLAARHYGVEDEVLDSLNNLLPSNDWRAQAKYMLSRSMQHGARRAGEMREAAKTVQEAGVASWMSEACVRRQQWAGDLSCEINQFDLSTMLDDIRTFSSSSPMKAVTN